MTLEFLVSRVEDLDHAQDLGLEPGTIRLQDQWQDLAVAVLDQHHQSKPHISHIHRALVETHNSTILMMTNGMNLEESNIGR